MFAHNQKLQKYFKNLGIAYSQLGNALIGGDPDETLSSRTGKIILANPNLPWYNGWVIFNRVLELFDKNHSVDAIEKDEGTRGTL